MQLFGIAANLIVLFIISFEPDVQHPLQVCKLFVEVFRSYKRTVRFQSLFTNYWVSEVRSYIESSLVNEHHCLLVKPLHTLAIFPQSVFN
jgi:hypothetical protein